MLNDQIHAYTADTTPDNGSGPGVGGGISGRDGSVLLGVRRWLYLVVGPGSLHVLQHDARLILTVTGILGTALILAGVWTYVRRAR